MKLSLIAKKYKATIEFEMQTIGPNVWLIKFLGIKRQAQRPRRSQRRFAKGEKEGRKWNWGVEKANSRYRFFILSIFETSYSEHMSIVDSFTVSTQNQDCLMDFKPFWTSLQWATLCSEPLCSVPGAYYRLGFPYFTLNILLCFQIWKCPSANRKAKNKPKIIKFAACKMKCNNRQGREKTLSMGGFELTLVFLGRIDRQIEQRKEGFRGNESQGYGWYCL